jgi:hypothetical protein
MASRSSILIVLTINNNLIYHFNDYCISFFQARFSPTTVGTSLVCLVVAFAISRRLLTLCWLYGAVVAGTCIFLAPKRERVVVYNTCKSLPSASKVKTCTLEAVLQHEAGFLRIVGPQCVILSTCRHGGGEPLRNLWAERALLLVLLLSLSLVSPAPSYLLCGCRIVYVGFGLVGRQLESAFTM